MRPQKILQYGQVLLLLVLLVLLLLVLLDYNYNYNCTQLFYLSIRIIFKTEGRIDEKMIGIFLEKFHLFIIL